MFLVVHEEEAFLSGCMQLFIVLLVFRKLVAYDDFSQLAVHVCMDMLVIVDDLSECFQQYLLQFIPLLVAM